LNAFIPPSRAQPETCLSTSRTIYRLPPTPLRGSGLLALLRMTPPRLAKPCPLAAGPSRPPSPPVSPSWALRSDFSFSSPGQSGALANHTRINQKGREARPDRGQAAFRPNTPAVDVGSDRGGNLSGLSRAGLASPDDPPLGDSYNDKVAAHLGGRGSLKLPSPRLGDREFP
jgi:hypothetical protein